jgi:hypothetical protein
MTAAASLEAVTKLGFTERQAGFLVTVLRHAGVCVTRQYCAYARITRGQPVQDFFRKLVERGYAHLHLFGHVKARVYHLQHKALYRAIGEPDVRFRKRAALGRAIERLMLLDEVLDHRDLHWLATEGEKVDYFRRITPLRPDELPRLVFGDPPGTTTRWFPDKLPIGIARDRDCHVFVYLATSDAPWDFRQFLGRHAELLRALPRWTLRVLVPTGLQAAREAFATAAAEELAAPLTPAQAEELRWYFRQPSARLSGDGRRFYDARRAFGGARFQALRRAWIRDGDRVLEASVSRILADAIARGAGEVDCHVLPRTYAGLSTLVGTA